MQLVLSSNRIIAHGENFLSMGGVVINTVTGAKYENATIAECNGCPSDIDKVGYEYHAGVFVPCAPFGTGNNNGYFMEVCESCATPRSSGISIKNGIKRENLLKEDFHKLLWENASPSSSFGAQTITLAEYDWNFLLVEMKGVSFFISAESETAYFSYTEEYSSTNLYLYSRKCIIESANRLNIKGGTRFSIATSGTIRQEDANNSIKPLRIYGVKL
jgi:hypothetical protein